MPQPEEHAYNQSRVAIAHTGTAEAVRIESDENGWELHVLDGDGWHVWNIHAEALVLLQQAQATIGAWWEEGKAAARAHVQVTEEDLEGYALDDPKRITLREYLDETARPR